MSAETTAKPQNDPELSELVAMLEKEQAVADQAEQTNPEVEAVKAKLRAEFQNQGRPLLERLEQIGASADFRAANRVDGLNFAKLVSRGVSTDRLADIEKTLREIRIIFNNTTNVLSAIPSRIAALTPQDIVRGRYLEVPSKAEFISADLKSAPESIKELSQRIANLGGQLAKVVATPNQHLETWYPAGPQADRRGGNPTEQLTQV